jgi:hypothetical protein
MLAILEKITPWRPTRVDPGMIRKSFRNPPNRENFHQKLEISDFFSEESLRCKLLQKLLGAYPVTDVLRDDPTSTMFGHHPDFCW